jgi:hypothetical protein
VTLPLSQPAKTFGIVKLLNKYRQGSKQEKKAHLEATAAVTAADKEKDAKVRSCPFIFTCVVS